MQLIMCAEQRAETLIEVGLSSLLIWLYLKLSHSMLASPVVNLSAGPFISHLRFWYVCSNDILEKFSNKKPKNLSHSKKKKKKRMVFIMMWGPKGLDLQP